MAGEHRLLDEMHPRSCWLDITSNDPRVVVTIVERATARDVQSVGVLMAGAPEAASDGSLGFFVAGGAVRHFGPIEGELLAANLLEHRSQTTLRA